MHAEEIADTLSVARPNVSNSLRELQNWNLVRMVHQLGDRRDHFETLSDPWDFSARSSASARCANSIRRSASCAICLADPEFASQGASTRARIRETLALMEALSVWSEEMLRLDTATLVKVMKLGARVRGIVRGGKASLRAAPPR